MSDRPGYGDGVAEHDHDSDGAAGAGGRPLRDVRAEKLLSISELARLAGVARSTIFLIETGRTVPRLSVVRRLTAALEADPQSVNEFRRAIRASAEPR